MRTKIQVAKADLDPLLASANEVIHLVEHMQKSARQKLMQVIHSRFCPSCGNDKQKEKCFCDPKYDE